MVSYDQLMLFSCSMVFYEQLMLGAVFASQPGLTIVPLN
jgi:hypothetical protein